MCTAAGKSVGSVGGALGGAPAPLALLAPKRSKSSKADGAGAKLSKLFGSSKFDRDALDKNHECGTESKGRESTTSAG